MDSESKDKLVLVMIRIESAIEALSKTADDLLSASQLDIDELGVLDALSKSVRLEIKALSSAADHYLAATKQ